MKLNIKKSLSFALLTSVGIATSAHAYNPILREFHSVRAAGMGDVRYTTGIFEENFFANPARSTQNPENLFQLPKISFEASSNSITAVNSLASSGSNGLSAFSDKIGKPLSARMQMVFPAYYNRHFITDAWSFGVGFTTTAQTIALVSQSGTIDPTTFVAAGPVFNLSRRFLEEDRLSVGINARTEFRANSGSFFSLQQFLGGEKIADIVKGGSGLGFDFDLGTSFRPHWTLGGFKYELGFAINNILGGQYKNIGKPLNSTDWSNDPFQTRRSFNLGVSAMYEHFWFLRDIVLALETTDNGNNVNGSFFRTLHIGGEAHWKVLAARLGMSQGYFTAGFGLDLWLVKLNIATYAEELGLNSGVMEDRRYALDLGFQI